MKKDILKDLLAKPGKQHSVSDFDPSFTGKLSKQDAKDQLAQDIEKLSELAPWYVIPADNKWFMRYAVGRIICDRMKQLDLHYPKLSEEGLRKLEECKKSVSDINF